MNENEVGTDAGEVCNRNNCKGIIAVEEPDGSCSCHINPPCSYCTNKDHYCELCGWSHLEEYQAKEKEYIKRYEARWEEENRLYEERENLFWQKYRGEVPVEKYETRVKSHTHFSQEVYGVFPPGTENRETIRTKWMVPLEEDSKGLQTIPFVFIAYTD